MKRSACAGVLSIFAAASLLSSAAAAIRHGTSWLGLSIEMSQPVVVWLVLYEGIPPLLRY